MLNNQILQINTILHLRCTIMICPKLCIYTYPISDGISRYVILATFVTPGVFVLILGIGKTWYAYTKIGVIHDNQVLSLQNNVIT